MFNAVKFNSTTFNGSGAFNVVVIGLLGSLTKLKTKPQLTNLKTHNTPTVLRQGT